jgi:signal transduction histidine kinase
VLPHRALDAGHRSVRRGDERVVSSTTCQGDGVFPKPVRDLCWPVLVAGVGALAALGVSFAVETEHREQILRSTRSIAAESRAAIGEIVKRQRTAARDRALRWARFGRPPAPEWQLDAQHLMKNSPGLRYVAWVSLGGAPVRVARAPDAPDSVGPDEAEARTHAAAPAIVGPERHPDGSYSYRLYEPVPMGAGAAGVLVAGVEVNALLADVLEYSAPGHAFSIYWGDQRVAARGEPAADPSLAWWRAEGEVPLAAGSVWRVVHAPTQELAETLLTPFPRLLLAIGLLLSAAAGVIAYQLRLSRQQARFLHAANRVLDLRVREARASEASLRRLSDELERRVRSRTRQLEGTLSDLEAFNFSVSHDLRSPIGAVLNFVAILEEEYRPQLDPAGQAIVARIRASAERAIDLLEGLLKLARAGRGELTLEELDMTALAREAFVQACDTASEDREVDFALAPLPTARGDRALIGSVLLNLLGNAVKYTRGREKGRIEVSGVASAGENIYAVSDNGVGFDSRFASKLFGAFERLHPAGEYEGAGIGLAIVARIILRHGGRVWAEGSPEQGARFFFSLPTGEGSPW